MPQELLPPEVTRVLSTHGEVLLTVGHLKHGTITARCLVAPFDEVLVLFVRPGSAVSEKMRADTRASVQANDPEKGYVVRLEGRIVAGPRVMAHPQRLGLLAWLPEGTNPRAWEAASFYADTVDYQRGGPEGERFFGKVPREQEEPVGWRLWMLAAFEGGWVFASLGVLGIWAWVLFQGPEMPLRAVALPIASLGALGFIAAGGLWFRATHFLGALERAGRAPHAALLERGLLAPRVVRQAALAALAVGVIFTLISAMWGFGLFAVTAVCSFVWLHWPIRVTSVFTGEEE
ncbi:MAG: hypothetical protein H6740_20795 [Alphaproteobacteria bacterium]|nr:hypothetical protein [Alphaproteobacteria bacterium]